MKKSREASFELLAAILGISLLPVLLDLGGTGMGVLPFAFFSFLIGTPASLTLAFFKDRCEGLRAIIRSRKTLAAMVVAGLLNYAVALVLLTIGTMDTNPSVSGVVYWSWVLIMALLSPFALERRLTWKEVFAVLLGLAGVGVLVPPGALFGASATALPYALILLSALVTATSSLMILAYKADTVGSLFIFNASALAAVGVLLLAWHLPVPASLPLPSLEIVAFTGVWTYAFGAAIYFSGLKGLGPVRSASLLLTAPFLTVVVSYLLVGTPIRFEYLVSALLIGIGILVQTRESAKSGGFYDDSR